MMVPTAVKAALARVRVGAAHALAAVPGATLGPLSERAVAVALFSSTRISPAAPVPAGAPATLFDAAPADAAPARHSSASGKGSTLSPEAILDYMYRAALADKRRGRGADGMALPAYLTSTRFLLGTDISTALSSRDAAAAFLEHALPPRVCTLTSLSESFAERMKKRGDGKGFYSDRMKNPLSALQSAPGGGKSAVLDLITLLCHHSMWTPELCTNAAMRDILNSSIPVAVTYNSGSDPDLDGCDKSDNRGLALRILHSYFIDRDKMVFSTFAEAMEAAGGKLTAVNAIEACRLDAVQQTKGKKRGIVLLVDEVAKLYKKKKNTDLVGVLGSLLNLLPSDSFNCVATTLNSFVFDEEATASRRRIHWAPLPPLSRGAAEAGILKALQAVNPTVTELPLAVKFVISDAAGHPRSLQYVMEAMLDLLPDGKHTSLSELREATLARLSHLYKAPGLPHVLAALQGKMRPLDKRLPGTGQTLRSLIASGAFLNTDVNHATDEVVPKLSMLQLLRILQTSSPILAGIRLTVKELAGEEEAAFRAPWSDSLPSRITLTGEAFERFVAAWLKLLTHVCDKKVVTPLELFNVSEAQKMLVPADSPLRTRMKLTALTGGIRTYEELLVNVKAEELPRTPTWVARFGKLNPAFDMLLTAPAADPGKGRVAVAVEAHISDPSSDTIDKDLESKHGLFVNSVKDQIAAAVGANPAAVAYVHAAVRFMKEAAATQDAYLKMKAPHGALVISYQCSDESAPDTTVQDFFTPTLADRAFFLLTARQQALEEAQKLKQRGDEAVLADGGAPLAGDGVGACKPAAGAAAQPPLAP